jgi:hypothetical protein
MLCQVPSDWEGEALSSSHGSLREGAVLALEGLVIGLAAVDFSDTDGSSASDVDGLNVASRNWAEINRCVAAQWKVNGVTQADNLAAGGDVESSVSKSRTLELVDARRGGKSNWLQDAVAVWNCAVGLQSLTDIGNPKL